MWKTKTWLLLIVAVAAVAAVGAVIVARVAPMTAVVEVVQDGVVINEIDLGAVERAYSFTLDSADGGYNVITVAPGRIRVSDADCPDGVCVHHGWLIDGASPIVCMPHKLMLRFKAGDGGIDAVAE